LVAIGCSAEGLRSEYSWAMISTVGAVGDTEKYRSETTREILLDRLCDSDHYSSNPFLCARGERYRPVDQERRGAMPIYRLIKQEIAFTPEEVTVVTTAFESTLQRLGLVKRADPLAEVVAKTIIDLAKAGERDPSRLCDQALKAFQSPTGTLC
jgi:hypothetical protein